MKKYGLLSFLFVLLAAGALYGQATLSMQGTIRNSTGSAVPDGTYSLTFKLYTVESGGTAVWTETQNEVRVVGGVYSALLGSTTPLNAAFNVPYYVGVAVDGGAELIPRFRLTSAPYALSLIGQGNTFPSSGTVGVGTASPEAGQNLHVHNASGSAKALISSADVNVPTFLTLRSGDKVGELAIEGGNGNFNIGSANSMNIGAAGRIHFYGSGGLKAYTDEDGFIVNGRLHTASSIFVANGSINCGNTDMVLHRNGDPHIVMRGDGWTEFKKALYVPNSIGQYIDGLHVRIVGAQFIPYNGQGHGVSIRTGENVMTTGVVLLSDARIKKNLQLSSGVSDLSTLMQLEVTDYAHVDTLTTGEGRVKGFIAQQVEKVYPQAVSASYNFIPSTYAKPSSVQVEAEKATFQVASGHHLAVGDKVRIIYGKEPKQQDYSVVAVEGSTTFSVTGWEGETDPSKVFIYGKEVNDFRTVDYDKIHTLNVSATQELARQLEQLRAENAELRRQNEDLLRMGDAVGKRLAKLEALLEAGQSKQ